MTRLRDMMAEIVEREIKAERDWDEFFAWQNFRWTGWLWPEWILRACAIAVSRRT